MISEDMRIDVSGAIALGEPAVVAATLHQPDDGAASSSGLLFCIHGGGYDRRYWHPDHGDDSYSFARFFTDRGYAVLAIDMLGMGESTQPEPEGQLSVAGIVAANAAALAAVRGALDTGEKALSVTGLGHSMGGMAIVAQAGAHPGLDRVAVIGWANEAMMLGDLDPATLTASLPAQGYVSTPRDAMRSFFYAADVPPVVIAADEARASKTPVTLGRAAMTPGIVHDAAAAISSPVLIVQSVVDTSPDPWREPAYFRGSRDVTLSVLDGAGHCQNFAGTRVAHWTRIARWIATS